MISGISQMQQSCADFGVLHVDMLNYFLQCSVRHFLCMMQGTIHVECKIWNIRVKKILALDVNILCFGDVVDLSVTYLLRTVRYTLI